MNRAEKRRQQKLAKKAATRSPLQRADASQQTLNLALQHHSAGRLPEAERHYQQILQADPNQADALHYLGVIAHQVGKNDMAVELINKALANKPDYAEAHSNLGNALQALGKPDDAAVSYDRALTIKPDYAEAHYNLGNALLALKKLDDAAASYTRALAIKPDYVEAHSNLCELYEKQNMIAELARALDQAEAALPKDDPYLLYRKAQLAGRENRPEDARDFLERIDPDHLALKTRQGHALLLAKTYDKLGRFSDAYSQFEMTNKIAGQISEAGQFNGPRYLDQISRLTESWSSAAQIKRPVPQASANRHSPAFLLGFPRSGTTLIDTILRSHPDISVVEEKPTVQAMSTQIGGLATPDLLNGLNDGQISDLSRVYFDELYAHVSFDSPQQLIIDKLPLNIVDVGLIHHVFPDAKFILALRHPCDCILSCFMQNFELNDAMANFLTLPQSARLYDAVMTLWLQYTRTLDLDVSALKYEGLVQDLQGTAEPLLNFLGLDWHDNLLNYQQTASSRGPINTPSYNQVTQNLYTQAIGRWKNYQDQMEGALPLLEPWVKRFGY